MRQPTLRLAPLGVLFLTAAFAACGMDSSGSPEEQPETPVFNEPGRVVDLVSGERFRAEYETSSADASGVAAMKQVASNAALEQPASTAFWDGIGSGSGLMSGQMVIRTGNATLEVESLDAGLDALREAAAAADGYVANLNFQTGEHQVRRASVQIKVPADRFEDLLSAVKPIGVLQGLGVQSQDVSEEFVDVQARVVNDKRMESRLLGLLETRAGDLSEVLTVERELARIRAEIERREGRLRYLQERARLSTLSLDLYEPGPLLTSPAGPSPIVRAVREAWHNMIGVVAGMITAVGALLPFAVLGLLIYFMLKRFRPLRFVRRSA